MGGVDRGKSGRSDEGIRQIKKDFPKSQNQMLPSEKYYVIYYVVFKISVID